MTSNDPIPSFWHWFAAHEPRLRHAADTGDRAGLAELLDPRVAEVAPGCSWDVVSLEPSGRGFVLSPRRQPLIETARRVVAQAPTLYGWTFMAGKPIDASRWTYRLTSYNNGEFADIDIYFEAQDAPPPDAEDLACDLVLEALLGEVASLQRIDRVITHVVAQAGSVEKSTPIELLRTHIDEVLAPYPLNGGGGP